MRFPWSCLYLIFLSEAVVVSVTYNDVSEWIPGAKDVELHGWVFNTYFEYIKPLAHASYPELSFRPPGLVPIVGGKERRREGDWTNYTQDGAKIDERHKHRRPTWDKPLQMAPPTPSNNPFASFWSFGNHPIITSSLHISMKLRLFVFFSGISLSAKQKANNWLI